jgi:hypothetical protein
MIGTNGQPHSITDSTNEIEQLNEPGGTPGRRKPHNKNITSSKRNVIRTLWSLDIDKLMKEGRCFRCRNTGHRANECPEDNDNKKAKEVPEKKMNGRELYAHVWVLFKEMTEEDRDEFLKGAEEAGF